MNKDRYLLWVLALIILATVYDLVVDWMEGASIIHMLEEGIIVVVSSAAIAWLSLNLKKQQTELLKLKQELEAPAPPPSKDSNPDLIQARHDMGETIRRQFVDWSLTPSESEVALLLLKGLSFKEISAVRDTAEKTVRQQASSIYRKAGVNGRHAFSAWFIEDIL